MRTIVAGLMLLLLTACATTTTSGPRMGTVTLDPESLVTQLLKLPGAVVIKDPLQFSYPDQSLFGVGAVLPLPGGTKVLDPLGDFFLSNPGLNWQVDVQMQTGHGVEYDQTLAEKRSELLATYLLSKGVALEGLHFQPAAGESESLIFTLKLPSNTANQK